ncbi:helix-turn-helix transcriptional regulator [Aquibaculum arenosum]|uniref:HTH luxR-type domain-containing protein n=1 Tax=Aquibaculum arenosum TaxID=3032591 RepID=A0ABT5YQJ7_9PROT|nr:hypothetical protein [Fodinicurvata sp. CAU 1616]MDF2097000.1 hypothetical protein [Fodinicurvata sp. CAU 1616]
MANQLPNLIGLIYETVFDDELWPQVLLRLAELAGVDVPAIGFFDPLTGRVSAIAPRTDPADLLKFRNDWAGRTTLFSDLSAVDVGDVVSLQDLVPVSALRRSAVFNELLRPMGLGSAALLANVAASGGAQAVLGLYREAPAQDQPFEQQQVETVAIVVRHIARAIELRKQASALRLREAAALRSLEHLRKGFVLLDAAGHVLFANGLASRIVDTSGRASDDFFELLGLRTRKAVAERTGETINVPRDGQRSALKLALLPLREGAAASAQTCLDLLGPAVIAIITDPDLDADHRCAALQERYGLTPAEAAFALEIRKGDGREAAAGRRGISVSTAHTHLHRIFEKTGVTRQAELVRLMLDEDR